uniref:ATP-binding cassette sub-family G member 4-like protein n=1 Tax=Sogatella furcifera TaxID=113103 RepID=A0A481P065_SOGFU|nr:ATP-binding cassette sub-family G member 4-like protein [Sogatella furcifera]
MELETELRSTSAGTYFSRHSTREPVELSFDNLTYSVSQGFRKGTKTILHNIGGRFESGQIIAIMGPSGAGKSSLLDLLSGYRISGVAGSVYVNDRFRDLDEFRRLSCYIQQDDRLQPLLTIDENMWAAADLKLPSSVTTKEKRAIIDEILETLKLSGSKKTRAGQLSGGQKKRLSIALELVNNPLVMFLDEPTTGLDSSSCMQCVTLLKELASQGRTIVCTIHQPSASLFMKFDHVYVLAGGRCLYQGSSGNLVPYLSELSLPCPTYHNPADYIIELACGEHGEDKIEKLVDGTENGKCYKWFTNGEVIKYNNNAAADVKSMGCLPIMKKCGGSLQVTSQWNQIGVLLRRGFIKMKRDQTLTHMRFMVNVLTGMMLGSLFFQTGNKGERVLDNFNLLFSILIHHTMTTKVLTILTFPMEMSILNKEYFNRWYSLKSYYIATNILDIPVLTICAITFSAIIYAMSGQPLDWTRFSMFTGISLLVVYISQSLGFMVGSIFNVVNGTFVGPTMLVPMMMFSGFGVSLRDIPEYMKWGTNLSYLRYSLEGYVAAIYGLDRPILPCSSYYCHYKYPKKFMSEVAMNGDQFWMDVYALLFTLFLTRVAAYVLLRWRIRAMR